MLITEVIPKAQVNPLGPAVFKIPGYRVYMNFDPEHSNLGSSGKRGICVYVKECVKCRPISFSSTKIAETVWLSLPLRGSDTLMLGCLYRSPSSGLQESTLEICKMIREVCSTSSHVLLAGDFNYPGINWSTVSSQMSPENPTHLFLDTLNDCFPRLEFWPFSGPFRVQKTIFSFRKILSQYSVPYRTRSPWNSEH